MTTEVEWRRKWKPGLIASPWQPITIGEKTYLIKYVFTQDSYEVLFTDMVQFWFEELSDAAFKRRVKKLNPGIEASTVRILDQIQSVLDKSLNEKDSSLKISFKDDPDNEDAKRVMISISSTLAGLPFSWNFQCSPADDTKSSEHLIMPLMAMVGEMTRRQQELVKVIQNKDKEIDDYKSQGAKVSRKHIETTPFVETVFEMNMLTSKGFEGQVKDYIAKTFDTKGQDLYRQVVTKQAWINRSPSKVSEDDSLLDDMTTDESRKSSTGPSWGNSRLPPSLQSKSPTKSPGKSPASSPTKSPKKTPEPSPVKDSEFLRRQALERRLEMEETKKMEKTKKKKKIGF